MRDIKTIGNRRIIAFDLVGVEHIGTVPVGVKGIAGLRHSRPLEGKEKDLVDAIAGELNAPGNSPGKTSKKNKDATNSK